MSGPASPIDAVGRWADHAVHAATQGEICEENLSALLRERYDATRAWSHARAAYAAMLEHVREVEVPLVLKLIVPLASSRVLEMNPPGLEQIQDEIDPRGTPPMLVVHAPLFVRSWTDIEQFSCPYDVTVFADGAGEPLARGIYSAVRTRYEFEDDDEYRRLLTFERVQNFPDFGVIGR